MKVSVVMTVMATSRALVGGRPVGSCSRSCCTEPGKTLMRACRSGSRAASTLTKTFMRIQLVLSSCVVESTSCSSATWILGSVGAPMSPTGGATSSSVGLEDRSGRIWSNSVRQSLLCHCLHRWC
ncbi:hypothetical protein NP493_126g09002 [Ridgeia piscesae]|uniref:Uncharacterized protein n=1 Tax=Ridgeia piscesae TaxID=27915 RepID=A0AAD9UGP7_RIDPI|nr:hypothetical protein NP493_126g09002 [Ridgeia piscesae]